VTELHERALSGLEGLASNPKYWFEVTSGFLDIAQGNYRVLTQRSTGLESASERVH
jgi:hypothetical protein